MAKGSEFEREMCKKISLWWTHGQRDDVFWRSQNSGGRATVRGRKGQDTHGQAGDIAAVHPCGEPLLQTFAVELKRGYKTADPYRILDGPPKQKAQIWEDWIGQVQDSQALSGAPYWLIINKRDRRSIMAAVPVQFFTTKPKMERPWATFRITVGGAPVSFVHARADNMLKAIQSEMVTRLTFPTEEESYDL